MSLFVIPSIYVLLCQPSVHQSAFTIWSFCQNNNHILWTSVGFLDCIWVFCYVVWQHCAHLNVSVDVLVQGIFMEALQGLRSTTCYNITNQACRVLHVGQYWNMWTAKTFDICLIHVCKFDFTPNLGTSFLNTVKVLESHQNPSTCSNSSNLLNTPTLGTPQAHTSTTTFDYIEVGRRPVSRRASSRLGTAILTQRKLSHYT